MTRHQEQRRQRRIPHRQRVEFRDVQGERWRPGSTSNLTARGSFIATDAPLPAGVRLRLRFLANDGFEIAAEVIHLKRGAGGEDRPGRTGMGVRFERHEERVAALLEAAAPRAAAARQPPATQSRSPGRYVMTGPAIARDAPARRDPTPHAAPAVDPADLAAEVRRLKERLASADVERRRLAGLLEEDGREKTMLQGLVTRLEAERERLGAAAEAADDARARAEAALTELAAREPGEAGAERVRWLETRVRELESGSALPPVPAPRPSWGRRIGAAALFFLIGIALGLAASRRVEPPSELPLPEPMPAATASAEPEAPAARPAPDRALAAAAVEAWRRAWEEQRVDDYLAAYADDFAPPAGLDRAAWAQQRRERLRRPSSIAVATGELAIEERAPDRLAVTFRQAYSTPTYADVVLKTLELVWREGAWRIVSETSVPVPAT